MSDVVWRGGPTDNPPGFQPQAVGNYPDASDVADKDNIFLTESGWVYRHYKSLDKQKFWDEIIWAGYVNDSVSANDPVDAIGQADPQFLYGDGIQAVSGPYPKSSSTIGTVDIVGPDTGTVGVASTAFSAHISGAVASGDTWKWECTSKPGGATVSFSAATGTFSGNTPAEADTTATPSVAGQYVFKLTLTDTSTGNTSTGEQGYGAEAVDNSETIGTVQVTGQDSPQSGVGVTYSANHTGTAEDADIDSYTWTAVLRGTNTTASGVTLTTPTDSGGSNLEPNQVKVIFTTQASVVPTDIKCVVVDAAATDNGGSGVSGILEVDPHFVIGYATITGPTSLTLNSASSAYSISSYDSQSNPAPNDLTYKWSASFGGGAAGTFNDDTAAAPTFTATAAGAVSVSVVVSSAKSDPTSAPKSNVINAVAS